MGNKKIKKKDLFILLKQKLSSFKLYKSGTTFVKRGFITKMTKSFRPCQPAQSAQAGMGENFSSSLNCLHVKG